MLPVYHKVTTATSDLLQICCHLSLLSFEEIQLLVETPNPILGGDTSGGACLELVAICLTLPLEQM